MREVPFLIHPILDHLLRKDGGVLAVICESSMRLDGFIETWLPSLVPTGVNTSMAQDLVIFDNKIGSQVLLTCPQVDQRKLCGYVFCDVIYPTRAAGPGLPELFPEFFDLMQAQERK